MKKFMNALTSIVLTSLTFVTCLSSCNNDDDNNSSAVPNTLTADQIVGKWVISDSSSPYASFEFTEDGRYIVVENTAGTTSESAKSSLLKPENTKTAGRLSAKDVPPDPTPVPVPSYIVPISPDNFHYGTYTIEGNTIILSGFGMIEAAAPLADGNFEFSFKLEATGETNTFAARQASPFSSSAKTELLCSKAWVFQRVTGGEFPFTDLTNGPVVLFSKTGSYLVLQSGDSDEAVLGEWRWADGSETAFYYSGRSGIDSPDAQTEIIDELTANSLVFHGYERSGVTFTYYLVPKN